MTQSSVIANTLCFFTKKNPGYLNNIYNSSWQAAHKVSTYVGSFFSVRKDYEQLQVYLKGIQSACIEKEVHSQELTTALENAQDFLKNSKRRFFFALGKKASHIYRDYQEAKVSLKLQVIHYAQQIPQRICVVKDNLEDLKKNTKDLLELWLSRHIPYTPDTVLQSEAEQKHLEEICEKLPHESEERKLFQDTLDEYKDLLNSKDKIQEMSQIEQKDLLKQALSYYCEKLESLDYKYLLLLLSDKDVQERFFDQVIQGGLDVKIFFEHPYVADFFHRHEKLERNIFLAGSGLWIDEKRNLPMVLLEGKPCSVYDIPGFKEGNFKNLMGWVTLGLDSEKEHFSLEECKERIETPNGFIYTKDRGFVRFNPRTWSYFEDNQWKQVDFSRDTWWEQIPFYESQIIDDENEEQRKKWSLKYIVSYTSNRPQFRETHAFFNVGIPHFDEEKKHWVRRYYSFGVYPYLMEGGSRAFAKVKKEIYPMDFNLACSERKLYSYEHEISDAKGKEVMLTIRQEVQVSFEEAKGTCAASYRIYEDNCISFLQKVASAAGFSIPCKMNGESMFDSWLSRFVYTKIKSSTYLFKLALYALGVRGEHLNWNGIISNPYTARRFLELKKEIQKLKGEDIKTCRLREAWLNHLKGNNEDSFQRKAS